MQLVWVLVAAMLCGSCVRGGDVSCGDTICPETYTCWSEGCFSPEQVTACVDHDDLAPCDIELGAGTCRESGCVLQACGNGIVEGAELCDDGNLASGDTCNNTCSAECGNGTVDPGEVCDDANDVAGDGCSGGCLSDETCGNGIGDYAAGEQCDDTNARNRDGCSSRCQVETQVWEQLAVPAVPSRRARAAIAFDTGRNRALMFGGFRDVDGNHVYLDETWQFRGESPNTRDWIRLRPRVSPTARARHAMAYDSRRGRVVIFGGATGSSVLDDTWEFDGVTWARIPVPTSPSARVAHALAYDAARGVVVLFGGDGQGRLDDTWEYDGTTWTQRMPATKPSARQGHAMAFDPVRNVIVLFGGATTSPYDQTLSQTEVSLQDTWEYDGTTWTPRTPTTPPPAREAHAMTVDASGIVIFGGIANDAPRNDTWKYTGTAWTEDTRTTRPSVRYNAMVAFDASRGRMLVFGGTENGVDAADDDNELSSTHELPTTGSWTTWSPPAVVLGPRTSSHAIYDTRRGRLVIQGGQEVVGLNLVATNEMWHLVAGVFRPFTPTPNLPARTSDAIVYDAARDRLVSFGGSISGSGTVDETWLFDGVGWTQASPATRPAPRQSPMLAYDSARERVVLYGGSQGSGFGVTGRSDTWEWDGQAWTAITTATSPPLTLAGAMVYDPVRRRTVLFGGAINALQRHDETWEYDGTNWVEIDTPQRPTARFGHSMAYDEGTGRIVLFGGAAGQIAGTDTWEYDGTTWTQFAPVSSSLPLPAPRTSAAMAYDPTLRRIVSFGGTDNNSDHLGDTWTFGYAAQESSEACGSGVDLDGDGSVGCADDDCWHICTPFCSPLVEAVTTCPASPRCGDGTCNGIPADLSDTVESCRTCPADCSCP